MDKQFPTNHKSSIGVAGSSIKIDEHTKKAQYKTIVLTGAKRLSQIRKILFPFSLLYAVITELRNFLFDKNLLKSKIYPVPIINVGNIRVGGTGKTPMIEYLIRLLQNDYKIAVVSRGYKRKTTGVIVAGKHTSVQDVGDEAFQIFQKFPNIHVVVAEKRQKGIEEAIAQFNPDVILLDDAFQHRWVKAGLNIVLTAYNQPFTKDYILPAGNLRECRYQVKRADCVVVTKSPLNLKQTRIDAFKTNIHKYFNKPVCFSQIKYATKVISNKNSIKLTDLQNYQVLLVTGIAETGSLEVFLSKKNINFVHLKFGDHHRFTKKDIDEIQKRFKQMKATGKMILTTEKDFVRLQHLIHQVYYLPIETELIEKEMFNNKILEYVRKK